MDILSVMNINQQMYTRERRGLYNVNAGYDSIAKSDGLTDSFVKGEIHPYCVFFGGARSLTVAHFSCGSMLLGQAVHVPVDFTGQRAAFFAHNYILPAERVGECLGDIERLFLTNFETSYELNRGGELEELDVLPVSPSKSNSISFHDISETMLTHITNCVIKSVESAKKTYVILSPKTRQKHEFACAMIVEIYKNLPVWLKHIFGFCTCSREPEKRKNIHLVFLESEAFRVGGTRFAGDFTVDLRCEVPPQSPYCIDFAAYISKKNRSIAPVKFFAELDFWRTRMPKLSRSINQVEARWLDENLDKLTSAQLAAIPSDTIKTGKRGENSRLFVQLHILKKVGEALKSNGEFSLRYFLGNYLLSPEDHARTIFNLRRIYEI